MQKLITSLNKFNGNLCFVGVIDSGDIIFECDRLNNVLYYAFASKPISGVCLKDEASYYVALYDNWLGLFSAGILNENYVNTGISQVTRILTNSNGYIYILDKSINRLYKGYISGLVWNEVWNFNLPDYSLKSEGNIILRESDGMIIYHNNSSIYLIRDDITNAIIFNSTSISGTGDLSVVISNEFNPSYAYIESRMVSGKDLEQSSSSSTSSFSSSSTSSSSESSESSSSTSSSSESSKSSSSMSSSSKSSESSSSTSSSSSTEVRSSSSSTSSSTEIRSSSSRSESSRTSSSSSSSGCGCTEWEFVDPQSPYSFDDFQLSGVREGNSDNCQLYFKSHYDGTNIQNISLYKDSGMQPEDEVALGFSASGGEITIVQINDSGISGKVTWNWTPQTQTNTLVCGEYSSSSGSSLSSTSKTSTSNTSESSESQSSESSESQSSETSESTEIRSSSSTEIKTSSSSDCGCTEWEFVDPQSPYSFDDFQLSGVREGNSDNCKLYFQSGFADYLQIVRLYKDPSMQFEHEVANGSTSAVVPEDVIIYEANDSGISGKVTWNAEP